MSKVEDFLDGLSVVFMRGGCKVYASAERGIKPLVAAVESGIDYSDCEATDRIVGKAAAMLYVLLRVKSVRACVMTHKAKDILAANRIESAAEEYADAIINRKGDGLCPMELTVAKIDDPFAALYAIREKLKQL